MRALLALGLAAGLAAPQNVIALAQRANASRAQAKAQADGPDARLAEARAGRLSGKASGIVHSMLRPTELLPGNR
jgi:hypothetical protein